MNFEFSDDQRELQNQLSRQLADAFPHERIMRVLDGHLVERKKMWGEFVELGYLGMAIPEQYGGVGYGYLELCLMAQEIGRLAIPVPMLSSIYLTAESIVQFGSEAQKEHWLPKILNGEVSATFAWSEDGNGQAADTVQCQWLDGRLSGVKTPVPDTDLADIAVVLAKKPDGALALCVVDLTAQGVSVHPLEVIDEASPHATINFHQVEGEELEGEKVDIERLFNRTAVLLAFDQVGGAQQCLAMSQAYASERFVFGRAIASYQALKHKMADIYVFIDGKPALEDNYVRGKLADWYINMQGLRYVLYRRLTALSSGSVPGAEAAMGKLVEAEATLDMTRFCMDLLDLNGITISGSAIRALPKQVKTYLKAPGIRIAGGTDEILRNTIAERVLGLPPEIRTDKNVPFAELKG